MSNLTIGLFLGSRREFAAVCIAEEDLRSPLQEDAVEKADEAVVEFLDRPGSWPLEELEQRLLKLADCQEAAESPPAPEVHFLVRLLERLSANSTYREIAERIRAIHAGLEKRGEGRPTMYVDATGKGAPVVDLLREACRDSWIVPVYFNHGDRRTKEEGHVILGKAYLVTRLQQLLETRRLHLPRLPGTDTLKRELLDFEIPVSSDANEKYGAFRVGTQDDRITALGLAVQVDPGRWGLT